MRECVERKRELVKHLNYIHNDFQWFFNTKKYKYIYVEHWQNFLRNVNWRQALISFISFIRTYYSNHLFKTFPNSKQLIRYILFYKSSDKWTHKYQYLRICLKYWLNTSLKIFISNRLNNLRRILLWWVSEIY